MFDFHERLESSWAAEQLIASQEELCAPELVSYQLCSLDVYNVIGKDNYKAWFEDKVMKAKEFISQVIPSPFQKSAPRTSLNKKQECHPISLTLCTWSDMCGKDYKYLLFFMLSKIWSYDIVLLVSQFYGLLHAARGRFIVNVPSLGQTA